MHVFIIVLDHTLLLLGKYTVRFVCINTEFHHSVLRLVTECFYTDVIWELQHGYSSLALLEGRHATRPAVSAVVGSPTFSCTASSTKYVTRWQHRYMYQSAISPLPGKEIPNTRTVV